MITIKEEAFRKIVREEYMKILIETEKMALEANKGKKKKDKAVDEQG